MARRSPLGLGLVALLVVAAPAFPDTFDYTFDRFEADGNVNGPLDGTPDFVDDFDDGVLAPWFIRRGTASESGGLLHVQSPGLTVSLPGLVPVPFEASAAGIDGVLQAGGGDGTLRIVLPLQSIGANDAVSFDLSTYDSTALYYAGIVLTNFNSSLAAAFSPPYPRGLAATAHLDRLSFTNEALAAQHQVIAPSSVTGPIVLELRYDDTMRRVTPAISVDGGATYAAVFAPLAVTTDWTGEVTVQAAAAAYAGSCPADSGLRRVRINGLQHAPGRQKMALRLAFPAPLLNHAFRLVVSDAGAGGATLFDLQLPAYGSTPCNPRDGWTPRGYVNVSNALPPDCTPGSALGLRTAQMKWNGTLDLRVEANPTSIPHATGPVGVTIYDGPGPVNECDGWSSQLACRSSPNSLRCDF